MYKYLQKANNFLLLNLLLIVFISDFISKVLLINAITFHRIGLFTKAFIFILFLLDVFFVIRNRKNKIFQYLLVLIGFVFLSQIAAFFTGRFVFSDFKDILFTLITYCHLPIFAIVFFGAHNKERIIDFNIKIFTNVAMFNSIFVIGNLLLNSNLLKSYPFSQRFGNNGLLLTASTASYFYVFIITILYYKYTQEKTVKAGSFLVFQILVGLLVGTKTIWFYVTVLSVIHFCIIISKPYRYIFRALFASVIICTLIFREKIELFIVSLFSFGEEIYSQYGIVSVITSTRDVFLYKAIDHIKENGTVFNYLIGGTNVMKYGVEFEFVNLFLFFGFTGVIIYLLMLKKIFLRNLNKLKLYLFLAVLFTASLAGGFLYSFLSSSLFLITFMYIDQNKIKNN